MHINNTSPQWMLTFHRFLPMISFEMTIMQLMTLTYQALV